MENFWTYFEVLAPSLGVALIFWFVIRAIFRADRNERAAEAQVRHEHAERATSAEQANPSAERPGTAAFKESSQERNP